MFILIPFRPSNPRALAIFANILFCIASQALPVQTADPGIPASGQRKRTIDAPTKTGHFSADPKPSGLFGGSLITAQKSEPETFNPITALSTGSKEIIGLLHADLIHINRRTLNTEPSLARGWEV